MTRAETPAGPGALEREPDPREIAHDATVMMVDDEPLNTEVLQLHLETEGYRNFIACSRSVEALETISKRNPDVLLLDLVMPEVSGFDILQALRADPEHRHLPVIVLTSSNDAATKLRALQLGATDFLSKPVDSSELALRLRNTLTARAWQRRVRHLDTLTELPNRLYLKILLERWLAMPERMAGTAALIVLNIDRFKAINDSLGTARGDEVLFGFRERLVDVFGYRAPASSDAAMLRVPPVVGRGECVARLGADKFAVLMPVSAGGIARELGVLLDRFAKRLEKPFEVAGEAIYVNASIGVAMVGAGAESVESLVNQAETAMHRARLRTDAIWAFYSKDMEDATRERLGLENGLRTAVAAGEIRLVYQPKVDVATGEINGAEALARWDHPAFGAVSPVDFIPLAEQSGMIVPIGAWVLQESCRRAAEWRARGHDSFRIAVNVSIRQLHEPNFLATVGDALAQAGLEPAALIVELTENMIMENAESNIGKLRALKALGVKLSIDDFGTGYSSLSYLQRFPLDQLKIDRSFVMEIASPLDRAPIVKAVTSLAHDLGLSVVAEGVETHHQLARIKALRCEEYQGFFFSRPVPAQEFLALLEPAAAKRA